MLNSLQNRKIIINSFPKLALDSEFKITSPPSPDYNCIAWAGLVDNEWWQAFPTNCLLDGVYATWPNGKPEDRSLKHYINLFIKLRYELTSKNNELIPGFLKVALYVSNDDKNKILKLKDRECTHAARQLSNGLWTSKLGQSVDILHSLPENIENDEYGIVGIIMKRKYP